MVSASCSPAVCPSVLHPGKLCQPPAYNQPKYQREPAPSSPLRPRSLGEGAPAAHTRAKVARRGPCRASRAGWEAEGAPWPRLRWRAELASATADARHSSGGPTACHTPPRPSQQSPDATTVCQCCRALPRHRYRRQGCWLPVLGPSRKRQVFHGFGSPKQISWQTGAGTVS